MLYEERRAHAREPMSLRLRMADGRSARILNGSPMGLYLVLPQGARVDEWVALEFIVPPGRLRFRVLGEVVRTERRRRGLGVGLRLHGHSISSIDSDAPPSSA